MKEKQALEAIQHRPLNRKEYRALLNRKCPCGSGKLYKNCCLKRDIRWLIEDQARMKKLREGGKG